MLKARNNGAPPMSPTEPPISEIRKASVRQRSQDARSFRSQCEPQGKEALTVWPLVKGVIEQQWQAQASTRGNANLMCGDGLRQETFIAVDKSFTQPTGTTDDECNRLWMLKKSVFAKH